MNSFFIQKIGVIIAKWLSFEGGETRKDPLVRVNPVYKNMMIGTSEYMAKVTCLCR